MYQVGLWGAETGDEMGNGEVCVVCMYVRMCRKKISKDRESLVIMCVRERARDRDIDKTNADSKVNICSNCVRAWL